MSRRYRLQGNSAASGNIGSKHLNATASRYHCRRCGSLALLRLPECSMCAQGLRFFFDRTSPKPLLKHLHAYFEAVVKRTCHGFVKTLDTPISKAGQSAHSLATMRHCLTHLSLQIRKLGMSHLGSCFACALLSSEVLLCGSGCSTWYRAGISRPRGGTGKRYMQHTASPGLLAAGKFRTSALDVDAADATFQLPSCKCGCGLMRLRLIFNADTLNVSAKSMVLTVI